MYYGYVLLKARCSTVLVSCFPILQFQADPLRTLEPLTYHLGLSLLSGIHPFLNTKMGISPLTSLMPLLWDLKKYSSWSHRLLSWRLTH